MNFLASIDPERDVRWGQNSANEMVLEGWDGSVLSWFVEFALDEVIVHTRGEPSDRFKGEMRKHYGHKKEIIYCGMGMHEHTLAKKRRMDRENAKERKRLRAFAPYKRP